MDLHDLLQGELHMYIVYVCGGAHVDVSTASLRGVEGDGKGTQCLEVYLGHPVTGGYKHRDLVLQGGGLKARLRTLLCKKIILLQMQGSEKPIL
jgi:hypothetical protein